MNKKSYCLRYVLLVSWMILIFMFSHEGADGSSGKSGLLVSFFQTLGLSNNVDLMSTIVRKSAHMTLFAVLSLLIYWNVYDLNWSFKKKIVVVLAGSLLYAISDELHQAFVPGRSGEAFDVMVDMFGVTFAIVFIIYFNFKNKNLL